MALAPRELADRITRITDDLGDLSAPVVIGFTEDPTDALQALATDARWAFVDLRVVETSPETELPEADVVVVVVGKGVVPEPLSQRIGALVDRETNGKLFVLCDGIDAWADLPPTLKRIPYSDFVRR